MSDASPERKSLSYRCGCVIILGEGEPEHHSNCVTGPLGHCDVRDSGYPLDALVRETCELERQAGHGGTRWSVGRQSAAAGGKTFADYGNETWDEQP